MSWSFTVSPTFKDEFPTALDAAEVVGDNGNTKLGQKQVAAAKKAIKDMAKLVQRPKIAAQASGHAWSEGDGAHYFDGFSVGVSGSE